MTASGSQIREIAEPQTSRDDRAVARRIVMLTSLRARFLLFAVLLPLILLVQAFVGWQVADHARGLGERSAATIDGVMADIQLLQAIKNMQIDTLLMQNEISSLATADPDEVANDVRQIRRKFKTALEDVLRVTKANHITSLGSVRDVADRIALARTSFDGILATMKEAQNETQSTGKAPNSALVVKAGAQVDGLYEQLDPMAEGVGLIVVDGNRGIVTLNKSNNASMDGFEKILLAVSVIGLLICGGVVFVLLRGVLRPLLTLTTTTRAIADGDLTTTVPHFGAMELDSMAEALEIFRTGLLDAEQLKAAQAAQRETARREKREAMLSLADGFEGQIMGVVHQLGDAVDHLRDNAQGLTSSAGGTLERSNEVARASAMASSSTQLVASAAEELARSIDEISGQMQNATKVAAQAVMDAQETDETVARLNIAAIRIGEVVQLIRTVARQTNLLALNATIEAARAGDAGRGFAVVAGEVKQLATQTAEATAEIELQIDAIQTETRRAVDAIRRIVATIEGMSRITTIVASAVEEQGAATQEIARSVQDAASGTTVVSEAIAEVTSAARDTGDAAGGLMTAAAALSDQARVLRNEVISFTGIVRNG